MSAAEVIEMIKKLPPEQRAEVIAFAKNERVESRVEEAATERKVRYISKEKFEEIAREFREARGVVSSSR